MIKSYLLDELPLPLVLGPETEDKNGFQPIHQVSQAFEVFVGFNSKISSKF